MNEFSEQLNIILVNLYNSILKIEESMLKDFNDNLSINEFHMIESIAENGDKGKKISELASDMMITPASVTVAVNKLVKKEYLIKDKDSSDGRIVNVYLTKKGMRIDKAHMLFHKKMVNEITKELNADERNVLINALSKLNKYFSIKAAKR